MEQPQAIGFAKIGMNSTGIKLSLQALQSEEWETVFSVEKATKWIEKEFPPVTARKFRLLIPSGKPNISEFQLFNAKR